MMSLPIAECAQRRELKNRVVDNRPAAFFRTKLSARMGISTVVCHHGGCRETPVGGYVLASRTTLSGSTTSVVPPDLTPDCTPFAGERVSASLGGVHYRRTQSPPPMTTSVP